MTEWERLSASTCENEIPRKRHSVWSDHNELIPNWYWLRCFSHRSSLFNENSSKSHFQPLLTHWGRVTHICVSKLAIIVSDNGLSPGRRQAIIWTNAGILLNGTLGTNFGEILGEIHSFSFSEMHLKMSPAKWRLFGLGLNELTSYL